jgi:hypothetical protein
MARAVAGNTSITFDLASNERLVVYTQGRADVFRVDGGNTLLGSVNGVEQSFGPIANGGTVRIDSFDHTVFFAKGTSPVLTELVALGIQRAPFSISATGSLPVGALFNGLINGTAGLLGITVTVPTGAAIDAVMELRNDDSFDWSVISAGLGTVTIGQSAGHSIVGSAGVGSSQSGEFRTRKTGPNTFITYRTA